MPGFLAGNFPHNGSEVHVTGFDFALRAEFAGEAKIKEMNNNLIWGHMTVSVDNVLEVWSLTNE
jgi:hypothetical protein